MSSNDENRVNVLKQKMNSMISNLNTFLNEGKQTPRSKILGDIRKELNFLKNIDAGTLITFGDTAQKYLEGENELVEDYNNNAISDNDFIKKYEKYPNSETGKEPPSETGKNPPSETGKNPPSETGKNPPLETGKNPPSETGVGGVNDEEKKDKRLELNKKINDKYDEIIKFINDLKKNSLKENEIKLLEEGLEKGLSGLYDRLSIEITEGKYDTKLNEPEEMFGNYISNLKKELSNITGKNQDVDNPPPRPPKNTSGVTNPAVNSSVPVSSGTSTTSSGGGKGSSVPVSYGTSTTSSGGGVGSGGVSVPPLDGDDNAVKALLDFDENNVSNKATSIQKLLENKLNLSLTPEIKDRSVTVVSIFKDGEDIKYDAFNVNDIESDSYVPATFTYNPKPPRKLGGNTHFKTIRNKHNNHHKTRKYAKKHLSKRKQVKLNKNRKTHHK